MPTELKNMKITAVALVDKGANKRTFYLRKQLKGDNMTKELALAILGSAKDLTKAQCDEIIAMVPEADKAEVQAYVAANWKEQGVAAAEEVKEVAKEVVKATEDQFAKLGESLTTLKSLCENILAGLKDKEPAKKEEAVAPVEKKVEDEVSPEQFEKMLNEKLLAEGLIKPETENKEKK